MRIFVEKPFSIWPFIEYCCHSQDRILFSTICTDSWWYLHHIVGAYPIFCKWIANASLFLNAHFLDLHKSIKPCIHLFKCSRPITFQVWHDSEELSGHHHKTVGGLDLCNVHCKANIAHMFKALPSRHCVYVTLGTARSRHIRQCVACDWGDLRYLITIMWHQLWICNAFAQYYCQAAATTVKVIMSTTLWLVLPNEQQAMCKGSMSACLPGNV